MANTPVSIRRRLLAGMDADGLAELFALLPEAAWALDGWGPLAPRLSTSGPRMLLPSAGDVMPLPATHSAMAQLLSQPRTVMGMIVRLDRFTSALLDLASFAHPLSWATAVAEAGQEHAAHLTASARVLAGALLVERGADDEWLTVLPDVARLVPATRPSAAIEFGLQSSAALRQVLARWPVRATGDRTDLAATLAAVQRDPDAAATVRAGLSEPARALLDRLVDKPQVSFDEADFTYRGAYATAYGSSPVIELWQHGLVSLDRDDEWVTATGEVALALGGRYLPASAWAVPAPREPTPLTVGAPGWPDALVLADVALDRCVDQPPPALKSGGMGVRAVRALAKQLEVPATTLGTVLQLLVDAGLLGRREVARQRRRGHQPDRVDLVWAPTAALAGWRGATPVQRWRVLVDTWRASLQIDECSGLPDRVAVDDTWDAPPRDARRQAVLDALLAVPEGCGADRGALAEQLAFDQPMVGAESALDGIVAVLRLLALVPADGPVGLTDLGRQILGDEDVEDLPPTSSSVVIQADHTIIAPPDLDLDVLRALRRYTIEESAAGARILRLDEPTIVAALDGGDTIDHVRDTLSTHSSTDLPQPVRYLLDDLARRQAALTVGAAGAYLVASDPALMSAAVAVRKAKLELLAPTVAVSGLSRPKLQAALRAAGVAVTAAQVGGGANGKDGTGGAEAATPAHPVMDRPLPTDRVAAVLAGIADASPTADWGTDTDHPGAGDLLDADEARRVATRVLLDEGPTGQLTPNGRWIPAD